METVLTRWIGFIPLLFACSQPQPLVTATGGVPSTGSTASTGNTSSTVVSTGPEICDGLDNDGDGEIDEEGGPVQYEDSDGDLYGNDLVTTTACDPGLGWSENPGDCDDTNPAVYPNAGERCDGLDNNCDTVIDEGHRENWYLGTLRDGMLYGIDRNSLVAAPLFTFTTSDPNAAFNSSDMLEAGIGVAHSNNRLELWDLDICNQTMNVIGSTNVGDMGGVAFNSSGDLFGIVGSTDQIVQINPNTGSAAALASIGSDVGNAGMAYDCATDTMYALDSNTDTLFEVDHGSGAILQSWPLSTPLGGSNGLEWDHVTDSLLATSGTQLYQIDPSSGGVTSLGNITGVSLVDDLAYFPPCP